MLDGVRVVDCTTEIAGPYCSKLLADAGADVVKVESPEGDPLRRWGSGALFEYLNTSKRSVQGDARDLLATADVFVSNEPTDPGPLWAENPSLVIVTITPFGTAGPWVGRPSTEFTLQAACGSIGQRGLPEQPPLAAGGRLGEWTAGTYAALGATAALREASRCGHGEVVDVAMLDCMAVTMVTYPSVFASFAGRPQVAGTGRTIEVPSIEPTRDGYFVITTNSAQQFQDFLLMIERPDLLADPDLPQVAKRFRRREEFLSAVHHYTTDHTTEEILAAAALFRIPAGPLLNGSTMTEFEQFVARGAFVPNPSGRFLQPRIPYRVSGVSPRPFTAAPRLGQHGDSVDWLPRTGTRPGRAADPEARDAAEGWRLPLADIRVVDCTAWWAGPVATAALAGLGAEVIKVESVTRPDNMRFASTRPPTDDLWWEWSPIFHAANAGKRGVTFDLSRPEGSEMFERLLQTADVLVENFTPRVMEQFGFDWDRVHALNDRLIMVRMPAFGLDGPWRDRTGFAQTMECLTGMSWLTGFVDGPPVLVRGACDPLAGMHAVIATMLALMERDQRGGGILVEAAMVESVLNAAAEQVVEYGSTGTLLCRHGNRGPQAAPQGVYPAAGEDQWVAIAVASDDQWRSLRSLLGDPSWAHSEELTNPDGRRRAHDHIDGQLISWTSQRSAEESAQMLLDLGIPSAVVVPPREIAANPQLRYRGLFEVEDHAVTGAHEIPTLPFRFSRVGHWLRSPAPTLGRDNDAVLEDLGYSPAAIEDLRRSGLVGQLPEQR
ncbi:MAG TPA: CoA transferase [Acidimicrobiales bacterium]|nr:CoA transferase [Acidimicrobiales bacterium]